MIAPPLRPDRAGFTIVELLMVVAICLTLGTLLLAAVGKGRARALRLQCVNNQRQLALAWQMYADDHAQRLVANGYSDDRQSREALWVGGGSHLTEAAFYDPGYLLDRRHALFAPYLKTVRIYKCPSDQRTREFMRRQIPQLRSYALNSYLGPTEQFRRFNTPGFRDYHNLADIVGKSPANMFLFMDVNPYSICFPAFLVEMPWTNRLGLTAQDGFFHFPSALHRGAGAVSFGDGHIEIRDWQDSRTAAPPVLEAPPGKGGPAVSHSGITPHNADLKWIQDRTTIPE